MRFVDSLRQPGDNERIEATCSNYIKRIISSIHSAATSASHNKQKRIEGYLSKIGPVMQTTDQLGHNLHYDEDPIDFKWVYSDLRCTGFNSNDTVYLTKEMIDKRVLPRVKEQLIEDGFRIISLRCESVQEYDYKGREILYKMHFKKIYNGKYGLYIFVDLAW